MPAALCGQAAIFLAKQANLQQQAIIRVRIMALISPSSRQNLPVVHHTTRSIICTVCSTACAPPQAIHYVRSCAVALLLLQLSVFPPKTIPSLLQSIAWQAPSAAPSLMGMPNLYEEGRRSHVQLARPAAAAA
jgi:hypothetical protein